MAGRAIGPSPDPAARLALLTTAGYGKQVLLSDFPAQGRNGQGVVAAKLTDRSGELAGAALLAAPAKAGGDFVVCLAERGASYVLPDARVPLMGRATLGKPVVEMAAGDRVWEVYRVPGAGITDPATSQRPRRTPQAEVEAAPAPRPKPASRPAVAKPARATPGADARPAPAAAPAKAPKTAGKTAGKAAKAPKEKPLHTEAPAAPDAAPQKAGMKVYSKAELARLAPTASGQPAGADPVKAPKTTAKAPGKAAKAPGKKPPPAAADAAPKKAGAKVYSKAELAKLAPIPTPAAWPAEEPAKSGRKGAPPKKTPGDA